MSGGSGSAEAFDQVFEPLVDAAVGQVAARLAAELAELRCDLHRHPELAGGERRTAAVVAERLRAAGLPVETGVGGHGVVAVVQGTGGSAGEGPTVAYRADLDAVPVGPGGLEGRPGEAGAAHLCGHDVHTAVGVGVASVLAALPDRIRGRAVFVFQPAEETLQGAAAMIGSGLLERFAPSEIYALHCAPLPVGTLAAMPGLGLPGQDRFTVHLPSGPGSAGSVPAPGAESATELATDLAALSTVRRPATDAQWQQLLGSLAEPGGPLAEYVAVETYGEEAGGSGGRRIHGSVRAWPDGRFAGVRAAVRARVAQLPGARVEFAGEPFPAVVCSRELSEAGARRIGRTLAALGTAGERDAGVVTLHGTLPFNSEDFALFLRRVPGAMFYLGVGDAAAGLSGLPHHPAFDPDERAIGIGVRAMAALLCHRITALT